MKMTVRHCLYPLLLISFAGHGVAAEQTLELAPVQVSGQALSEDAAPLHLEMVNSTGSRLGLSVRETPAIVETKTQKDMQHKGLRTTKEALPPTLPASRSATCLATLRC